MELDLEVGYTYTTTDQMRLVAIFICISLNQPLPSLPGNGLPARDPFNAEVSGASARLNGYLDVLRPCTLSTLLSYVHLQFFSARLRNGIFHLGRPI
jgi:hypothetical protein